MAYLGETMEIQDTGSLRPPEDFQPKNKSCFKCGHLQVCSIYRAVGRFMKDEFPETKTVTGEEAVKPPFKIEQLALICTKYTPVLARIET